MAERKTACEHREQAELKRMRSEVYSQAEADHIEHLQQQTYYAC